MRLRVTSIPIVPRGVVMMHPDDAREISSDGKVLLSVEVTEARSDSRKVGKDANTGVPQSS